MYSTLKTVLLTKQQVRVEVKCIFIRISQIDTVHEHYSVEASIQAIWREPLLDNKFNFEDIKLSQFWNPNIYIENVFGDLMEMVTLEVSYPKIRGEAYILEKRKIKGVLRETLELQHFPFDCQDLSIVISTRKHHKEVNLVESDTDISNLNVCNVLDSQEWELHKHVDVSTEFKYSDNCIGPKKRQIMTFTCRVNRKFGYFVINHLMISSMLAFLAFCSFSVVSSNTFGRIQLCTINLLTTVAFKVSLSQNLPKISYLTYLDKAVLTNIFVIASLSIWHAFTSTFFYDIIKTNINVTILTAQTVQSIHSIEIKLIPCFMGIYLIIIMLFIVIIVFDAGKRRSEMNEKDKEFEKRLFRLQTTKYMQDD